MATLYRMLLNTKHCYIIYQHRITFNYEYRYGVGTVT